MCACVRPAICGYFASGSSAVCSHCSQLVSSGAADPLRTGAADPLCTGAVADDAHLMRARSGAVAYGLIAALSAVEASGSEEPEKPSAVEVGTIWGMLAFVVVAVVVTLRTVADTTLASAGIARSVRMSVPAPIICLCCQTCFLNPQLMPVHRATQWPESTALISTMFHSEQWRCGNGNLKRMGVVEAAYM